MTLRYMLNFLEQPSSMAAEASSSSEEGSGTVAVVRMRSVSKGDRPVVTAAVEREEPDR